MCRRNASQPLREALDRLHPAQGESCGELGGGPVQGEWTALTVTPIAPRYEARPPLVAVRSEKARPAPQQSASGVQETMPPLVRRRSRPVWATTTKHPAKNACCTRGHLGDTPMPSLNNPSATPAEGNPSFTRLIAETHMPRLAESWRGAARDLGCVRFKGGGQLSRRGVRRAKHEDGQLKFRMLSAPAATRQGATPEPLHRT